MSAESEITSKRRTNLQFGAYFILCSILPVLAASGQLPGTEMALIVLRSLIDGFAVSIILLWLYARYMRNKINTDYLFLFGSGLYYLFLSSSLSIHIDSNPLKTVILVLLLALPVLSRIFVENRVRRQS